MRRPYRNIREVSRSLEASNPRVNLGKSDFGQAEVKYLGQIVGYGKVAPVEAKIQVILESPSPSTIASTEF